jgi:hypothetical protein
VSGRLHGRINPGRLFARWPQDRLTTQVATNLKVVETYNDRTVSPGYPALTVSTPPPLAANHLPGVAGK